MDRRHLLIGGISVVVLAAVVLILVGLGAPDAGHEDVSWGEVNDERIEIESTVWVDNPYPGVSATLDIEYALALNEHELATGSRSDIEVPRGNHTQTMTTDLHQHELSEWWASHVDAGGTSNLTMSLVTALGIGPRSTSSDINIDREFELDFERVFEGMLAEIEGAYPPQSILVEDERLENRVLNEEILDEWPLEGGILDSIANTFDDGYIGEVVDNQIEVGPEITVKNTDVTLDTDGADTVIELSMDIENGSPFPLPPPVFTGGLALNDEDIATWEVEEQALHTEDAGIHAGESESVTIATTVAHDEMADWFQQHIAAGERSDAEVTGQLAFSIAGNEVTIPPPEDEGTDDGVGPTDESAIACTVVIETDILTTDVGDGVEMDDSVAGVDAEDSQPQTEYGSEGCSLTRWNIGEDRQQFADFDLTATDWFEEIISVLPRSDGVDDPRTISVFPNR